jgi:hypothetical protein
MQNLRQQLHTGSHTLSYLLGGIVVLLALTTLSSNLTVVEITNWAQRIFGVTFIALLLGLIFLTLFCWLRLSHEASASQSGDVWLEAGLQAANGITTLALTYTLLGISLGIGSLAGQTLTPETVQPIIRDLTGNFSMAFMTTVIGLPLAAFARALIALTIAARRHPQH